MYTGYYYEYQFRGFNKINSNPGIILNLLIVSKSTKER
jgi:hypothetical protein